MNTQAAHTPEEYIDQRDQAYDGPAHPERYAPAAGREHLRKRTRGDALDRGGRPDHAHEQVRHNQAYQCGEEDQAEAVRLEPVAEELNLGLVSVALAEGPEPHADEEEAHRMEDA
jgi:hypothetical protein